MQRRKMRSAIRSTCCAGAVLMATLFSLLPTVVVGQSRLPPCSNKLPISAWDNCQGTNIPISGTTYVGEFKGGKPNGRGTYISGWDKYIGEVRNGRFNGQGTRTYSNGNVYVGEFKDGKTNGQGTQTFINGDKYVGDFKDGKINGQGAYTFSNGNKYVGEFKDDKLNGQGTLMFANGEKYVGHFKDGKQNGQGTATSADGDVSVGIWADGKLVKAASNQEAVQMEQSGGVYVVPVRFNDIITLNAIVDSGAADVSIPADSTHLDTYQNY